MPRIRLVIRCDEKLKWDLKDFMAKQKIDDYEEALERLLKIAKTVGRQRTI